MKTVNVIYASTTGATESAAKQVAETLGAKLIPVTDASDADFDADLIVLGCSTWGAGDLQEDWEDRISILENAKLKGKKVALFGLGDQENYADTFVNAMGTLYETVTRAGADVVGKWPTDGYRHTDSTAVVDGAFVGLALDEDNESDLTAERIANWCKLVTSQV